MATILCLAHHCENHGPTCIVSCEGLPVGCVTCFEDDSMSTRRPSSSRSLNPADGLAAITRSSNRTNSTSSADVPSGDFAALQISARTSPSIPASPPPSPRVVALQGAHGGSNRRDSSFRKTYDENDKKRAIPCENCALTLPRQTKEGNTIGTNGPILRTRKPYERINAPSPPKTDSSNSSNSSDSENAISSKPSHRRTHSRTLVRIGTSSSNSSSFSRNSHVHYLDYTSTHEPLSPNSFSMVRQACLRTLSCETLPPSSTPNTSSPTSPFINSPFSSGPSSAISTSGGPIFFGDPQAGYTTAYIFRIPDPNARGRRRVYALMALSTHRERAAMQSFSFLSDAFRRIAAWIQGLAETELERSESVNSPRYSNSDERTGNSNNNTPTSAFLSGKNRGPDGKYAGMSLKARGLAELVGMPDFFFELHKLFVQVLAEMSATLGL
ncbi:hypothetical protein ONS95_013962 [Cadophora gregata]|uniref:uncharacterized protein n=1 Tax=Cadophora gregata TaxID=51156 RepID=UPI0026DACCA2|nr:uncharacterized protein ONS95_013962 [Cadophora gregata]KAK0113714.1 hypothetical protein ONS96_014569 [Cadophora gregata f. sp. sojae]KAK0114471.1 hypothetical protein ONS95_013962 [Cadophora gregata]